MARFAIPGFFIALAFTIYAIVDISLTDKSRVKSLNKVAWVLISLVLIIGPILWFTLGRKSRDSGVQYRTVAPDDDPTFLGRIGRDEEQDERIRRLEEELAQLDSNDLDGTDHGAPGAGHPDDDQPRR